MGFTPEQVLQKAGFAEGKAGQQRTPNLCTQGGWGRVGMKCIPEHTGGVGVLKISRIFVRGALSLGRGALNGEQREKMGEKKI